VLRPGDRIVKTGYFMYDGSVRCPVRIVQTDTIPGTGDFEDEPELADDRHGTFFRIDITAAGSPDRWASSIEPFDSLDTAVAHLGSGVIWSDDA
jgi:hypothetical protein